MLAVLCKRHGPPETLVIEEVPSLEAAPGEVVIAVHAASVNFPDTLIIENKYQFKPPLPFSPGGEVAGTVKQVGLGVTGFKAGDRVIALCGSGAFAEEVRVAANRLVHLPPGVAMVPASALLTTYGTTHHALKDRAQLQPGETLLVLGAAGGTGASAIEIGKQLGARVIAAASSDEKLALCRRMGADDVINYARDDLREQLRKLVGDKGVDVVYDPVGGPYAEPALRSMAWCGRYLVIGFAAGEIPKVPLNLPLLKGCAILGVFYGSHMDREPQRFQEGVGELLQWLAQGRIKPAITVEWPLERTAEALQRLGQRQVLGKIVLTTALGRTAT
ncbi:MAG: NADPH:quinone oxidoreductase family protein [Burkholderiales bacterium]